MPSLDACNARPGGDVYCTCSGPEPGPFVDPGGVALLPRRSKHRVHHCRSSNDALPLSAEPGPGTTANLRRRSQYCRLKHRVQLRECAGVGRICTDHRCARGRSGRRICRRNRDSRSRRGRWCQRSFGWIQPDHCASADLPSGFDCAQRGGGCFRAAATLALKTTQLIKISRGNRGRGYP
jgi:hypothetical protein